MLQGIARVGGVKLTLAVEMQHGDVVLVLAAPVVHVVERVVADVVGGECERYVLCGGGDFVAHHIAQLTVCTRVECQLKHPTRLRR